MGNLQISVKSVTGLMREAPERTCYASLTFLETTWTSKTKGNLTLTHETSPISPWDYGLVYLWVRPADFFFTFNEILLLLILLFLLAQATHGATWEWFYVIIFDFDLSKSSDGLLKADGAGVSGD